MSLCGKHLLPFCSSNHSNEQSHFLKILFKRSCGFTKWATLIVNYVRITQESSLLCLKVSLRIQQYMLLEISVSQCGCMPSGGIYSISHHILNIFGGQLESTFSETGWLLCGGDISTSLRRWGGAWSRKTGKLCLRAEMSYHECRCHSRPLIFQFESEI